MRVFIPGLPQQQGSKTVYGRHAVESNKKLKPWRHDAITAIQRQTEGLSVLDGPVAISATFVFPRPASHFGTGRNAGVIKLSAPHYKDTEPDLDKLLRAVFDAMTQAGAWRDDKLVVHLRDVEKIYGVIPGIELEVNRVYHQQAKSAA